MSFGQSSKVGSGPTRETHPAARKLTSNEKAAFANTTTGFAKHTSPTAAASPGGFGGGSTSAGFGALASAGSGWAAGAESSLPAFGGGAVFGQARR